MELTISNGTDYKEYICRCFQEKKIVPIVGTGLSCGVETSKGKVPSGEEVIAHMLSEIKKNNKITSDECESLRGKSFSSIAMIYEDDDIVSPVVRKLFYKSNFYEARFNKEDIRSKFLQIDWPYIYSLNIDDLIENSSRYKTVILPKREFYSEICNDKKCVFKLHGDISEIIKYKDSFKVFTSKEYVESVLTNRSILSKLQSDYASVNLLFFGCSLKDEMDLLSIDKLDLISNHNNAEGYTIKKNIFFTVGKPSLVEEIRYKQYGITDVAVFDDYNAMYELLYNAWEKAKNTRVNELEPYKQYVEKRFEAKEKHNLDYFYMAFNSVNVNKKTINFPHYYIERDLTRSVIEKIDKYSIQFVVGQMFCGKSYFLINLYRIVKDRDVYYFDSNTRLSDEALDTLLQCEGVLSLFDTDSLNYEQIEKIIEKKCNSSFIIMLSNHNVDILSMIEAVLQEEEKFSKRIFFHDNVLNNKLSYKERLLINKKLPQMNIIPMKKDETFINHIIRASEASGIKTKYSEYDIPQKTEKELALSIALASFETLTYEQIVMFEFDEIINGVIKEKEPLIEKVGRTSAERCGASMAGVKYVLNSKYWMRRELDKLKDNEDRIVGAYRYLIQRCIDFEPNDVQSKRLRYKKIIYFDTINGIFAGRHFGSRSLVVKIYTNLEDLLGADYQYNHQRAKCLMRNAYYLKNVSGRESEYKEAFNSAKIAQNQVLNAMDTSSSKKLKISLAHIEYTIASIMSSICECEDYTNGNRIEQTINICGKSINNIYNREDVNRDYEFYRNGKHKYGAIFFIFTIMEKNIPLSKESKKTYEQLINYLIKQ